MTFTEPSGLSLLLFIPLFLFILLRNIRRRRREIAAYHLIRKIIDSLPFLPRSYLLRRKAQVVLLIGAVLLTGLAAGGLLLGPPLSEPMEAVIVVDHLVNWSDRDGWESLLSKTRSLIGEFRRDDRILLISSDPGTMAEGFVSPGRASRLVDRLLPSDIPPRPRSETADSLLLLEENRHLDFAALVTPDPARWARAFEKGGTRWRIVRSASPPARPNFAVIDVDILPNLLRPGQFSLFCRVGAFASPGDNVDHTATVTVSTHDRVLERRSISLKEGKSAGLVFPLLEIDTGLLTVHIEPADLFPDDNFFISPLRTGPTLKGTLITTGNHALQSALHAIPGLSLTVSGPGLPGTNGTVSVYDGIVPEKTEGSTLLIRPFGQLPEFEFKGEALRPSVIEADLGHPLLRSVSFQSLKIKRLPTIIPGPSLDVIAKVDGYPFLMAGKSTSGGRMAVLAFDPVESGWVYEPSFPILVANLVSWLGQEASGSRSSYRVGERLAANVHLKGRSIIDPSGNVRSLSPLSDPYVFRTAGRYRLTGGSQEESGEVFVNLLSEEVSRSMAPTGEGASEGGQAAAPARPFKLVLRDILLIAGALLLLLELLVAPTPRVGRLPQ